MEKQKKLIIIGLGETAEIAYEYFTYDSPYEVIGFSVNKEFLTQNNPYELPVYPFEELETLFPPDEVDVYVAISYVQLNRVRRKMFLEAKAKGYTCASYVSSKAFVWRNVQIGENVFIFENNVIQHHVKLGDNIILWSGNHIGHRTEIQDHVYISSHVVISGFCVIGESSFLGVNSTFNDNIKLGKDNIVGSGSLIVKNSEDGKLLVGSPARSVPKTSYEAFQVSEEYL